jgi:hypothetical protein
MKFMLLIHQGTTPLPGTPEWDSLSGEEQGEVYASYQEVNETPGTTPGERMADPADAKTVRVEDGRPILVDGPFAEVKEALGGYLFLEADDLAAAVDLAAKIPAARMGGAVEIRPLL